MKIKSLKGFTLVELLVVIAIIGLLAATSGMIVVSVRARARDARRVANVDQLMKAFDLYTNQTGNYPISVAPVCIDGTDSVSLALQTAGLIGADFKDPIFTDTNQCYRYTSDAAGTSYALRYFLESQAVAAPGYHTVP
jgi:prepilin-type N-terminal cleavage/methylation domain-containing protein